MDEKDKISPEVENAAEALENKAEEIESTPVIESASTAPVAESTPIAGPAPETKPKKKKTGLVVGLSVGALALIGGGVGIATYAISNTPENIALSAISDFMNAKTLGINGSLDLETKDSDHQTILNNCGSSTKNCIGVVAYKNPLEKVHLDLKTEQNEQGENSTTATLTVKYDGKEYKLSLGSIVIKDYTVYISIEGLKNVAKDAVKAYLGDDDEGTVALYDDLIDTVVGEVDGKWWKISVPDIVDAVEEISSSDKSKIKKAYECTVDALDEAKKSNSKYADLYKKNAFIKVEKYYGSKKFSGKGTPYGVTFDAEKYVSFINAMADEVDSLGINDCLKELNSISGVSMTYKVEKVDKKTAEQMFSELPEIVVTIKNGLFSHELTGVYVEKEDSSYSGKVDLTFSKNIKSISAPSDAKPATDLYKNVMNAYKEWEETAQCKYIKQYYPNYFKYYCDANYHAVRNYEIQPNVNI